MTQDWWNLADPSFGLNERFQTALRTALKDYIGSAVFEIQEAEGDEPPGELMLVFQLDYDAPEQFPRRKSLRELLTEFIDWRTPEDSPEMRRAKRLLAALDADT